MNLLTMSESLLNQFKEHITIFSVEKNETIQTGDFVVVNTRTLQASLPKKESGYFSVGRAIRLIQCKDGDTLVICKDGIFKCDNTDECEHSILKDDVDRICYFENDNTVSLDNINATKAGTVLSSMEDGVLIKIDVNEGSGMEW